MTERDIFMAAVQIKSALEREVYLQEACGTDPAVRERVRRLLQVYANAGSFLELPAAAPTMSVAADEQPLTEGPGTVIGPYKLLEQIGEGGMGTVYMAQQTEPVKRLVGLKVIKPGMDSRQVIARFEAERQALALMDHPNIARVFDAGTTETGRPYFVMELVKGVPLTKYCDEHRLSPKERLKLFIPVCQAIQHAHQKGIIHRDIKPSNVLVAVYDGEPVPKVIDFGIAKAAWSATGGLTDKTLVTGFGAVIGTLEYMSPEQAEMNQLDIDTRSDIYSLGVLLYELLTGTTPLDRKRLRGGAMLEMLRVIREEEPPRPSTRLSTMENTSAVAANRGMEPKKLSGLVRGELDWIVMKALEKDRKRRYETASGLANDVRRYLDNELVAAGPPSLWYRMRKSVRRNRAGIAVASIVGAGLVAAAVLAVVYATQQVKANRAITGLAGRLQVSLEESNRLLAIRNFDRGRAAFEKVQIGSGLLWMIESWRSAIAAGDTAWQHAARANLAAWRPHYAQLKAIFSHPSPVIAAAFSPDGGTVISGSEDGTARLWDAATGKGIGLPLHHGSPVTRVAFSPVGNTAVTTSDDHTARLWDARTGEPLGRPLRHDAGVTAVVVHPSGKLVLTGTGTGDNTARLWDTASGQPIGPPLRHQGAITAVAFSPDGKTMITSSQDGTARLWETATGKGIASPLEHGVAARVVGFSPDGKTVYTLASTTRVWIWDPITGKSLGSFELDPLPGGPEYLAVLSPDGKSIVYGCSQEARLRDAFSGKPFGSPLRHESDVRAAAFSPDGKTILTGSRDKVARLWDAATGQLLGLLEHQGPVVAVAFNPDGKTLLTASEDGTVRIWDANPGKPVGEILEFPCDDSWSTLVGQGEVVVSYPREQNYQRYLQLWDPITHSPIGARLAQPGGNEHVILGRDGKILWTIEADKATRRWDAATGTDLGAGAPFTLSVPIERTELSPDGETLFIGGKNGTAWLWDLARGAVRGRSPVLPGSVDDLEFSPDGKMILTGLATGQVHLWDAPTFTTLGKPIPHPGAVGRMRFSPDGKSILVSGEDGTARLWDLATRTRRLPPLSHDDHGGWMSGLAFSPDGKIIATGSSSDKTARLWHAATGQPIGPPLRHEAGVGAVTFSADGRGLFTVSGRFRRYHLPPDLPDDLDRVAVWVEVITGLTLDTEQGLIQVLDNAAWLERRNRLESLGGPPETGLDRRLDQILHGPVPTARAESFMDRKQWAQADAAFAEAVAARPFNMKILIQRGDLYARRGFWSEAAAYYGAKVEQFPSVALLHEQLAVTRLLAEDLPGYHAACVGMLERFKPIDDSITARRMAYACSLAPGAVTDLAGLIQVSERSTRWIAGNVRLVGAVLFRAGRLEKALGRFEEMPKAVLPSAWDWLFLAMIHGRLQHPDEARRMLALANQWIKDTEAAKSWDGAVEKPTILRLRNEAEAVVLLDPTFPADPFAH
jgi:WD40 repeat protein/serine/threonine protein kinase/tetratricopeptide (TPR) repeat protein